MCSCTALGLEGCGNMPFVMEICWIVARSVQGEVCSWRSIRSYTDNKKILGLIQLLFGQNGRRPIGGYLSVRNYDSLSLDGLKLVTFGMGAQCFVDILSVSDFVDSQSFNELLVLFLVVTLSC